MAGKEEGGRGRVRSGDYITGCHKLGGLEHTHTRSRLAGTGTRDID